MRSEQTENEKAKSIFRSLSIYFQTHVVRPPPHPKMANPVCFFDMTIGGEPAGRIEMTLRADVTPKTAGT
tara:strand:- start:5188 stop:5397 length:210 start_codon:yes stop_codon:yes gene_type:complete